MERGALGFSVLVIFEIGFSFFFFSLKIFGYSVLVSTALRFSLFINYKSGFSVFVIRLSNSSEGLIALDHYPRLFFGFDGNFGRFPGS